MEFELSVHINRPPHDVFAFLRDKDRFPQEEGSPVLLLEKTTEGPPGVGTRYREIVQMLPWARGEIQSEIVDYEPGVRLSEEWSGAGMDGDVTYLFVPEGGGTRLVQRQTVVPQGWLRLAAPLIRLSFGPALRSRLEGIRRLLDAGWHAP